MTNHVLIGHYAGADLPEDSNGVIIIGHNIRSLDKSQSDVVFLGDNMAISKSVFEAIAKVLQYDKNT